MVIDSSALIAIVMSEVERQQFFDAIAMAQVRLIAAPTMLETSIVTLSRRGEAGLRILQEFCSTSEITVAEFTPNHTILALDAFRRFGKGRHPVALNLGNCCAYALARATNEPLLFKGNDFARTDIVPAV